MVQIFVGFEAIADDYSIYKSGNLAGGILPVFVIITWAKMRKLWLYLKKFDGDEAFLSPEY